MISCKSQIQEKPTDSSENIEVTIPKEISVGANNTATYLKLLKNKNIAVVANQTSVIFKQDTVAVYGVDTDINKIIDTIVRINTNYTHLVDSLLAHAIQVKKVFAPEHGFRGKADAGEHVEDGKDAKTGLSIISLHGKNRKPSQEHLEGLDLVVFDIQDVGVRFYTYITTLQYVMEACAEAGIPVIVFDRPNPNGHYIDGPTLEPEHSSFLGLNPIPLVYGMTIGEYAQMINGENWLKGGVKCDLTVIPLEHYTHASSYSLPIRPSPNLPNDTAINLYPSLGLFEGTTINAGRGTEMQFQVYGAPFFPSGDFTYTPKANFGSKYPKHKNKLVNGVDIRNEERLHAINLKWIIDAYQKTPKTETYFGPTFTIHAGTKKLQEQLEKGMSQDQIKATWQKDLEVFKEIRKKYLIYE